MSLAASIPQREGAQRFKNWYIGKKGIPHSFHRLGGEKGPTIFRPIAEFINGKEMPLRLKAGENELSSFIAIEQGVSFAGMGDKFACLLKVRGAQVGSYEQTGPIEKFFRTMRKVIKDQPGLLAQAGFAEWIGWTANRGILTRIEDYGFMQGSLFANGKQKYLSQDQKSYRPLNPIVLQLGSSAWGGLLSLCNQENPNYQGNPEDWNARYACGDLVSSGGGKLLTFDYHAATQQAFASYTVGVGQAVPFDPRTCASWWRPWEEVLNFLDAKEQFTLLLNHFPAEALDYVFAGTPYHAMMPEDKKGSWQRAVQPRAYPGHPGAMPPGYPPAGQQYPAQPQPQQYPQAPQPGYTPPTTPQAPQPGYTPPAVPQAPAPQYPAPAPTPAAPQPVYTPPTPPAPAQPNVGGIPIDLSGGPGAGDEGAPWVTGQSAPVPPGPGVSVQMGAPTPAFPSYPAPNPPAPPAAAPVYPAYPAPQGAVPSLGVQQAPQPQYTPPAGVPPLNPAPTGTPPTAGDALEAARARLGQVKPPTA